MSVIGLGRDRQLLPRWQPSTIAIENHELASQHDSRDIILDHRHFEERKQEWQRARQIEIAAELVGSAIVLGRTDEIQDAARFIYDSGEPATRVLREMASIALGVEPKPTSYVSMQSRGRIDFTRVYRGISALRAAVHRDPRNVLAHVDLARLYTLIGQFAQAERHLRIAIWLAPTSRFVLRCASRFFAHVGDVSQSLRLLRTSPLAKVDPWVMAAEIALSQLADRSPKFAAIGANALKQKMWVPRSQAELAGAVASLQLREGAIGKAKRLFETSLIDPTENAVAQAQWSADKISGLLIPAHALRTPRNFEAEALRSRAAQQWDNVIESCWNWADYEPTSSRPMLMGSFVAATVFGDPELSLTFVERGLESEPREITLLNNRSVALAELNNVPDAIETLALVDFDKVTEAQKPVLLATQGLIQFRLGQAEKGRALYERALVHPAIKSDLNNRALALLYLAREEGRLGTSEALGAVARAEEAVKRTKSLEITSLFNRVKKESSRTHSRSRT